MRPDDVRGSNRVMPPEWADHIEAIVADWGPLTDDQRDRVRTLLAPAAQVRKEGGHAA